MIGKLAAYSNEMRFALSAAADPRSALRLIARGLAFHLYNAAKSLGVDLAPRMDREEPFEACLDLGFGRHSVWLRHAAGDLYILTRTFVERYHTLPESMLRGEEVRTIVDLGANIGMASLAFHARYPKARLFAIEPLAANYRLLCRNTERIPEIVPVRAAVVGEPRRTVRMTTTARAWGNQLACEKFLEDIEEVPARTVEELLDEHGLDWVDILKVDIEGAEAELFARPSFLARVGLVVIELHPPYDFAAFQRDIAAMNFLVLPPDPQAGRRMPIAMRAERAAG